MITLIPIEPLSEAHGMLIVQAFNKHFVDGGGQEDGCGDGGYGWGDGGGNGWGNGWGDGGGNGWGNGGERPEEWTVDESNQALTGGQNQETLREEKR
jgi:hypothetical protein